MSIMYPSFIPSGVKSPGEIEIYERLKSDPDTHDWIVLHSLDVADHRSKISGEVDFVVIIPEKGVICVEVKAASTIRREQGIWYYGRDPEGDARGPFKQVSETMHSLRSKVSRLAPSLSKVVFWSCVIFPYINFKDKSPEWHEWQLIDRAKFTGRSISGNLLAVISNARSHLASKQGSSWFNPESLEPSPEKSRILANILRPDFEFFESSESRSLRLTGELKKYTEEQFEALDTMSSNPRVIFQGPAGTGKTLLALESARRSAISGRKTLFLCYNRILGNWLKKEAANLPNLVTATLHGHMLTVAEINYTEGYDAEFWRSQLPQIAIERIIDNANENSFDQLIIDEAQDILATEYLDFLDLSLTGGLSSGNWFFFGDFEKQAIYEKRDSIVTQLSQRFQHVPKYSLRTNCRNTPRIAEFIHLLGNLKPHYTKIRRPDNHIEPKLIIFRDTDDQNVQLKRLLDQLIFDERHTPQEIVILSRWGDQDAAVNNLPEMLKKITAPLKFGQKTDKIPYCSIHSFKGMEAPIVIITDIENIASTESQSLFYVGITRALDKLFILASKNASREINEILLGA